MHSRNLMPTNLCLWAPDGKLFGDCSKGQAMNDVPWTVAAKAWNADGLGNHARSSA